jgi:nitrogenase molybdenum-iron protein beta chain
MVGALRALHGINDSMCIIHGRNGCHCGALLLQVLGSDQSNVRLVNSGLKGSDEVYSGEERLVSAIRLADTTFNPRAIAVLSCSAPVIMGEDVEGLLHLIRNETRAELLTLDVGGPEGPAWLGYEEALEKLVSLMQRDKKKPLRGVNILGFKADDFCSRGDLTEMKRILRNQCIPVNAVLSGSGYMDVINAPRAKLNILLGGDGIACAKSMEEEFGTPYISVPYPYGLNKTLQFIELVTKALAQKPDQKVISREKEKVTLAVRRAHMYFQGIYSTPVAVIGESSRAFDMADFVSDELGMDVKLLVLSSPNYVTLERKKSKPVYFEKLLIEPDRWEMNHALTEAGVSIIIGSSFEKRIASEIQASLVRFSYPVTDQISLSDLPFAGFAGIAHLSETVINSIIMRNKEEVKT